MTEAGQVRWAPEGLAPHERPANQRRVDQTVPKGPLPRPEREPKPARAPAHETLSPGHQAMARVPADGPAAVDSREPEKPVTRKVVPPQPGESIRKETAGRMANYDPRVQVDSDVPQKGALDCPSCERQGFKDFNGLRIHMAKAHKE